MTTKKELFKEYGSSNIATSHLTNSSGLIVHYINYSNDKILISIVSSDTILSTHYVKLYDNGGFRIGSRYFNMNEFIRSNY